MSTPLGQDVLLLNRFTFRERLGTLFEIQAELSSVDANVDYRKVVGHPAAIRLEMKPNGTRFFHGHVSRFVQTANQGHFARYRATIVPWLWFLTRTSDCRVFQRKSVVDIAEEVFNGHRFGSEFYDLRLRNHYPKRRYCVQYRETDFNFISRLLESEGIYYWFDQAKDRPRLVLADDIGASKKVRGFESLKFNPVQPGAAQGRTDITEWLVQQEVQPVSYRLKDFDFKHPSEPLLDGHEIPREHGMARFAMYDYPGEYFEPDQAKHYSQLRLEELQSRYETMHGVTQARGLSAGQVFELRDHPRQDQNRKYLVTEVALTADAGEFETNGNSQEFLTCCFTSIPSTTPYRPPRVTPKPIVQGVQTATVVGPAGKEVYVDTESRVKVQFHWDRYGKRDGESSCWVRVAQPWAGGSYGGIAIPRVGHEVVVDFLEGDPDRPIINGRVYNGGKPAPISKAGAHMKVKKGIKPAGAAPGLQAQQTDTISGAVTPGAASRALPPSAAAALRNRGDSATSASDQSVASERIGTWHSTEGPDKSVLQGVTTKPAVIHDPSMLGVGPEATRPAGPVPGRGTLQESLAGGVAGPLAPKAPPPLTSFADALGHPSLKAAFASAEQAAAGTTQQTSAVGPDKLMTSFRSDSVGKGGESASRTGGHNEITMNDAAGEESLYVKAQHDKMVQVGNDRSTQVGNDSFEHIASNRITEVGVDSAEKVGNNLVQEIGANAQEKVGANKSVQVGANAQEQVGAAKVVNVGTNLLITAGTSITFQCGASTIHMNQAGVIAISGAILNISGSVLCNIGAPIINSTGLVVASEAAANCMIGGISLVAGGALTHITGGGLDVIGGSTIISGKPIKLN
jgi:type VI secretion system secreted protein VgrG